MLNSFGYFACGAESFGSWFASKSKLIHFSTCFASASFSFSLLLLRFAIAKIHQALHCLDFYKSLHPDVIPPIVLKMCDLESTPIYVVFSIFPSSFLLSERPGYTPCIALITKRGHRTDPSNYPPSHLLVTKYFKLVSSTNCIGLLITDY